MSQQLNGFHSQLCFSKHFLASQRPKTNKSGALTGTLQKMIGKWKRDALNDGLNGSKDHDDLSLPATATNSFFPSSC
jgi:hypothetical protein